MIEQPEFYPRRNWLLRCLEASIAATGAAFLYPVVRFLWPRPTTTSGATEMVAPYRLSELRPDAEGRWPAAPFDFGGKPCLLVLTAEGLKSVAEGRPPEAGELKAFNAVCTHLDCTVEFRPAEHDIFCPCHSGVYDLNGRNVSGPPPRPLEQYVVTLRGEKRGQEEIIVARTP